MQFLSQQLGIHEGRRRTFHVSIPSLSKSSLPGEGQGKHSWMLHWLFQQEKQLAENPGIMFNNVSSSPGTAEFSEGSFHGFFFAVCAESRHSHS